MIQPEPEDLPKDNPKLEIAVLSSLEEKQHKFTLLDEDTNKEEGNIQNYIYPNTWSNINDNDEDEDDLYDLDMYSIRSVSDGDENDSFINDGTTDYDTTDDEDKLN
ncbi:hypothetical protein Tco_1087435 [Tanacetum coccineum]